METSILNHSRLKSLFERMVSHNLPMLFVVAFFVGFTTKTFLRDAITIGYDDYTLPQPDTIVDLNTLEKELIKNGTTRENPVPKGDTCEEV